MAPALGTLTVERHADIGVVDSQWEDLATRTGAAPWLHPGWARTWWEAFGTGRLEVVALREGGRTVGIVPLAIDRWKAAATTNWHTPEFGLLADPGRELALADALFATRPPLLSLGFVAAESGTVGLMTDAAARAGYRVLVRTIERSPYVALADGWEAYLAERGGKMLRELRRRRRGLEAKGRLTVDVLDGTEGLEGLLQEGLRVEASGWKGQRGSAVLSDPATHRFYEQISRWASERGWLRLGFLRLDETVLAFDLSIEHDGVHYLLKTGYDPAYRKYAPGMLMRYEMLARAFSLGLHHYEFLGDDESWKLEWTTTTRDRLLVQCFSPSAVGHANRLAYAYGRPMAKRVVGLVRR